MLSIPYRCFFSHRTKQRFREETFLGKYPAGALKAKGGISDDSVGTLALLTFILTLLGLIVDVIRLTVEVMAKFSQTKSDDNKRLTAYSYQRAVNLFD